MSRRSSNTPEVPQAKNALDRFKFEVANEIGVPLKQGYNGDLTSRENGSVGGEMVRQMIRRFFISLTFFGFRLNHSPPSQSIF